MDFGVDNTHTELLGRVGTATVGNGGDPYAIDARYHGTKIAGIIGAIANNKTNTYSGLINGICWDVQLYSINIQNQNPGYQGDINPYDVAVAINQANSDGIKVLKRCW